jgi:MFS transporter, DHA1 family, multidrug resistance protein
MNGRLFTFFASYFLLLFARASIYAYLPLSLLQYTNASMFVVGLNYAIPYIAQFTTMVYFGKLLDKGSSSKRYQSQVILGFSAMAAQFILYYIMGNGSPDAFQFLVVSILCNLLATAYIPAVNKYVSALNPAGKQGYALSSLGVVDCLAFAAGSFLGGFVFQAVGINVLFLIASITAASGLVLILIGRPFVLVDGILRVDPPAPTLASGTNDLPSSPEAPRIFIHFMEIVAFLVVLNVSIGLFFPFYSPYMESLNGEPSLIGTSNLITSVIGVFVFKIAGRYLDKKHPHFPFVYGSIGYIVVFLILIVTTNPIVALISWAIPVFPYFVGVNYIVAIVTPLQHRGRAFSLAAIAQISGIAVGSIIGGILLSQPGISFVHVLVIGTAGLCISLAIFLRAWFARRHG